MKNYEAAIKDDTKAIELQPRYPLPYLNRAIAYLSTEKNDLALADCDKYLEIDPTQARVYFIKGLIYEKINKNDEAIATYKKIFEVGMTADSKIIMDAKNKIVMLGGSI